MHTKIYIGCQGWIYKDWNGVFYPPKSRSIDLLGLYSKIFDTVEVDSTFYAIPDANTISGWFKRTSENFKFSIKLLSEITHKNRLKDSEKLLEAFLSIAFGLKQKLGCILIQLPPDFSPSEHKTLSQFLRLLPKSTKFAIEFRDANWINASIVEELEESGVAFALADSKWLPRDRLFKIIENLQITFSYIRWLGPRELTNFSHIQIDRTNEFRYWNEVISILSAKSTDLFAYFNNHYQGHSPSSCNEFKSLLGLEVISPATLISQPSLF